MIKWSLIFVCALALARAQNGYSRDRPDNQFGYDNSAQDYQDEEGNSGGEIPGEAGRDYPVYSEVPETSFSCSNQQYPGYYADPEAQCQAFYICQRGGKTDSFLCPNGTVFNQEYLVCDWWYNFDCNNAESLYSVNEQVLRAMEEADARLSQQGQGGYDSQSLSPDIAYGATHRNGNGNGQHGNGNGYHGNGNGHKNNRNGNSHHGNGNGNGKSNGNGKDNGNGLNSQNGINSQYGAPAQFNSFASNQALTSGPGGLNGINVEADYSFANGNSHANGKGHGNGNSGGNGNGHANENGFSHNGNRNSNSQGFSHGNGNSHGGNGNGHQENGNGYHKNGNSGNGFNGNGNGTPKSAYGAPSRFDSRNGNGISSGNGHDLSAFRNGLGNGPTLSSQSYLPPQQNRFGNGFGNGNGNGNGNGASSKYGVPNQGIESQNGFNGEPSSQYGAPSSGNGVEKSYLPPSKK